MLTLENRTNGFVSFLRSSSIQNPLQCKCLSVPLAPDDQLFNLLKFGYEEENFYMELVEYSPIYQTQVKDLVVQVHEEFGFSYHADLDSDLDDLSKTYIEHGGILYILLEGTKVVGTVAIKRVTDSVAELKRMYLLKEYRGQGWGSRLLEQAINFCKERRFKECRLDTTVRQTDAQMLYQKKGFIVQRTDGRNVYMVLDLDKV